VRIITEQQVSVASGKAVFERLHSAFPALKPEAILGAGAETLRDCGLTRQKTRYVLTLAEAVREGRFDAAACQALPDAEARTYLTGFLGIGRWSASIYMLFCEGRPDIWPPSDVALIKAYATAAERPAPTSDEMERLAERWAPHRGAAAHLLWAYYAVLKGRTPE
jgi:DNA-3-methyladenine glycosylase II